MAANQDTVSFKKIRTTARRISFLMPHQNVLPDLKELAEELTPTDEYMHGAHDALLELIAALEEKGPHRK